MRVLKRQESESKDVTITIEYSEWNSELEEILSFIEGKKKTITGYSENKEMHSLRLDKILYFEAVGELVFAYTKDNVYEVKMRLYQVEELAEKTAIHRASKSILVNVSRIDSLKPALNGRFFATMQNGESILISRSYAKNIAEFIKSA